MELYTEKAGIPSRTRPFLMRPVFQRLQMIRGHCKLLHLALQCFVAASHRAYVHVHLTSLEGLEPR